MPIDEKIQKVCKEFDIDHTSQEWNQYLELNKTMNIQLNDFINTYYEIFDNYIDSFKENKGYSIQELVNPKHPNYSIWKYKKAYYGMAKKAFEDTILTYNNLKGDIK